jgi:hypothetical protein
VICVLHRYDLNLDEMRALTVQRVNFTLGLPLLKRALQELVSVIVISIGSCVCVCVCVYVCVCVCVCVCV